MQWLEIDCIGHNLDMSDAEKIEHFKRALKQYALHPMFDLFCDHSSKIKWIDSNYTNTRPTPDFWQFHGNFWDLSLVFRFETNNETLVNELKSLIEANMATKAYKDAVADIKERELKYKKYLETGLRV